MIVLGVDPGISGALALVDITRKQVIRLWDMPTEDKRHGKGRMVDPIGLKDLIEDIALLPSVAHNTSIFAIIERVQANPSQGVTSMFSFGYAAGMAHGCLVSADIPVDFVTPQKWKKQACFIGKDKDAPRQAAIKRWPYLKDDLKRKRDQGRADAIYIALYDSEASK